MKSGIIGSCFLLLSVILVLLPDAVMAVTIRYALIIGNNDGVDSDGSRPFTPLMHAEREAVVLRDKLVKRANFDPSHVRTRVLTDATRAEVQKAVNQLVTQRHADAKTFGKIDTLFMFYFTGHGLDGRLLLKDGPLQAEEIGRMFSKVDADFSIGVFDACFAGSLDKTKLTAKGIHAAPGLNLFRELPEEVLSAEGRIWFVSSSSNQESFEDEQLGGVFTHFFTEALEKAEAKGPGITLDNIWQYARTHTIEYTARRKRNQVPEQFIDDLRSSAPIYFSFLKSRTATLELSRELEGRFALAYTAGNLTEVFEKKRGDARTLAVYPGQARLMLVSDDNRVMTRAIHLKDGEKLALRTMAENAVDPNLGERSHTLVEKGINSSWNISASHIRNGPSVLSGVGYNHNFANDTFLFARQNVFVPVRVDFGRFYLGALGNYGYDRRTYPAWTHSIHEVGGALHSGYAFSVSDFRLGVGASFYGAWLLQKYEDDTRRTGVRYSPAFEFSVLYSPQHRIHLATTVDIGAAFGPGVGAASDNIWQFTASIKGAVYFRLL